MPKYIKAAEEGLLHIHQGNFNSTMKKGVFFALDSDAGFFNHIYFLDFPSKKSEKGAFLVIGRKKVYILPPVEVITGKSGKIPGTIISLNGSASVVATGDSKIKISKCCLGKGGILSFGSLLIDYGFIAGRRLNAMKARLPLKTD